MLLFLHKLSTVYSPIHYRMIVVFWNLFESSSWSCAFLPVQITSHCNLFGFFLLVSWRVQDGMRSSLRTNIRQHSRIQQTLEEGWKAWHQNVAIRNTTKMKEVKLKEPKKCVSAYLGKLYLIMCFPFSILVVWFVSVKGFHG